MVLVFQTKILTLQEVNEVKHTVFIPIWTPKLQIWLKTKQNFNRGKSFQESQIKTTQNILQQSSKPIKNLTPLHKSNYMIVFIASRGVTDSSRARLGNESTRTKKLDSSSTKFGYVYSSSNQPSDHLEYNKLELCSIRLRVKFDSFPSPSQMSQELKFIIKSAR